MKRTIAALLIAAAALPLIAMGGSESGVETVTVWHSNSGKAGAAFDQIVEDFNATIGKEKGIEIEPVYQGLANDVLTKVKAAASADLSSLPDIAQMDATSCLDMMNADYLIHTRGFWDFRSAARSFSPTMTRRSSIPLALSRQGRSMN